MFRSHLFGSATVVTSDAEVSRFVLHSDARAFVPWYPRSLTELMGESSILLINGSLQRRVHGLVGAFFKSPQLKAQVTADMQRRLAPALAAWKVRCASAPPLRIQDHAKTVRTTYAALLLSSLQPAPAQRHASFRPSYKALAWWRADQGRGRCAHVRCRVTTWKPLSEGWGWGRRPRRSPLQTPPCQFAMLPCSTPHTIGLHASVRVTVLYVRVWWYGMVWSMDRMVVLYYLSMKKKKDE